MRRLGFITSLVATIAAAFAVAAGADDKRTYMVEMYNAFGIVPGSDVRVAGVNAGSVADLHVNSAKRAVVEVELSGPLSVLGEDTTCASEPQSLIAEYFIDCAPDGPAIEPKEDPEEPDIPADQVEQTVQPDLVANTLREPYKRRLQLLINEFGTALAGNPDNLNEAIRLGAPALSELEKVLRIMASQNKIIKDLNVDSDKIIGRLTERREDVVAFIEEARDTARASAERRDDLSADFAQLDDFLAELQPTLADLEVLAREQTPLLTDLRASAPGLNTLMLSLPDFNAASERSLESLGDASLVGVRALTQGREEIEQLGETARNALPLGEFLSDFLRDIDDPKRAVERDLRSDKECNKKTRPCYSTGRTGNGFTGMEGLLNWVYYTPGVTNQFDQAGHLLHFTLNYIFSGPCGHFHSGREVVDAADPNPRTAIDTGIPKDGSSEITTNWFKTARCAGWMGPNQFGLTDNTNLPPYQGGPNPVRSVCPDGVEPVAAETLCDPLNPKRSEEAVAEDRAAATKRGGATARGSGTDAVPDLPGGPDLPDLPGPDLPRDIDDLLDLPPNLLDSLPQNLRDRVRDATRGGGGSDGDGRRSGGGGGNGDGGGGSPTNDLLDYLLGP